MLDLGRANEKKKVLYNMTGKVALFLLISLGQEPGLSQGPTLQPTAGQNVELHDLPAARKFHL